jgi:hypothetical protein
MGGERQSLIDVELARNEFRLDVLKLRQQLAAIGVRRSQESQAPAQAVVTTPQGAIVEPASEAAAVPRTEPAKPEPARAGSA